MWKKNICFISQFPPPIHGLSKAVDTVYNSKLKENFSFEKVNITDNKRFINNIIKILKSKSDLFYFTISQTKGGNIRDLIILKILLFKRKKYVIHLHGGYYRTLLENEISKLQKKINYKLIKNMDGAIVLSESLKYNFEGIIDSNKIFVVPNCVDDEFFMSDEEFNEKLNNNEDNICNILYLSNFIQTKGYRDVLKLANLEKERCMCGEEKYLHFNFAGAFFEEEEKKFFFEYIKNNGLEKYVTYHGIVKGEQKKELLKKNNIFILLTRYKNEGQPISIIEAMGNGMAIISTNHAGIPDLVKHNLNGYINSKIDIKDIYNWILSNRNCLNKIICNNRKEIKENYMQDMYLQRMKHIFEIL